MIYINRRKRIEIAKKAVEEMDKKSIEFLVCCYIMKDYAELDIKSELNITSKKLKDVKESIKRIFHCMGLEE